jgi:chromosome segregation ATPase
MTRKKTEAEKKKTRARATANKLTAENQRVEIERLKAVIVERAGEIDELRQQAKDIETVLRHHKESVDQVMSLSEENSTLKDELREAIEERDSLDGFNTDLGSQVYQEKLRARKLKAALESAYKCNDVLLGQLAGCQTMPDGRSVGEHAREMILAEVDNDDWDTASSTTG